MRNLILVSLLALAFSCSNVGKFQEAINTLSTDWDAATAQVTEAVNKISQTQDMAKSALSAMNPDETVMAKLTDEQKTKIDELKQGVQGQMASLGQLAQTAFEFVSKWQKEGENMEALKEGLANKKLPKDVQATIDNLKAMATTGTENAASWNEQASAAADAANQASQAYNELISAAGAAK
ncbi:MAG: hypothetical protein KDC66_10315 [Phaeodactylibacter sp.]|nr:hypothetical protein [Phaeodactylibacter sp.]MCB9275434.1 hypothetical protein [Lewinellaceae bacterium]